MLLLENRRVSVSVHAEHPRGAKTAVLLRLASSGVRGGAGREGLGEGGGEGGGGVSGRAVPGQSEVSAQLEVVVLDGLVARFEAGRPPALLHLRRISRLPQVYSTGTIPAARHRRETPNPKTRLQPTQSVCDYNDCAQLEFKRFSKAMQR